MVAAKARLAIGKVGAPPGDETLSLRGEITLPYPYTPPVNPVSKGARILVDDATRTHVIDISIPGGFYDPSLRRGWTSSSSGWSYRSSTGAIGGITKIQMKTLASTPGLIKFVVKGRNGTYPAATSTLPLRGTLVIDTPNATTGQCGDANFGLPPARPACTNTVTSIKCR